MRNSMGKFEQAGQQRAPPRMVDIFRRQHSLHDGLIGAPVVEPQQRNSKQQPRPRDAGIVQGPDQGDEGRIDAAHHRVPTSGAVEGTDGYQECAGQQDDGLDRFGIDDGAQTSHHGIQPCRAREHRDDQPQRPTGQQQLTDQRAAIENGRGIDEDVEQQRQQGKVKPGAPIETSLQKLRHGEGLAADDVRQQEYAEEHQNHIGAPFIVVNRQAYGISAARQSHQCGRRHIRGKQRQANRRPARRTGGEEIIDGRDPPPRDQQAQ